MRDKRFVAEHRGGPLKKEEHQMLMTWACDCAEHILPLYGKKTNSVLINALKAAENWTTGKATVGDARNAAVAAHRLARKQTNPTKISVARAVGHAAATAHMADHCLGPAWYALKAVKSEGKSTEEERKWQDKKLPPKIKKLILSARKNRKI